MITSFHGSVLPKKRLFWEMKAENCLNSKSPKMGFIRAVTKFIAKMGFIGAVTKFIAKMGFIGAVAKMGFTGAVTKLRGRSSDKVYQRWDL